MALRATPIETHRIAQQRLRRHLGGQQESTSRRDFYAALGAAIQLAGEFIRLRLFEMRRLSSAAMIAIQLCETLSTAHLDFVGAQPS